MSIIAAGAIGERPIDFWGPAFVTLMLLVLALSRYQGRGASRSCPLCGSRTGEHTQECPWHRQERQAEGGER